MTRKPLEAVLEDIEVDAVHHLIRRVIAEVPATLVHAALFGSRARGDARPTSDVDILLIFRWLPPDREPHATIAEEIAAAVATESDVPITVWSVSLPDLWEGHRTPMLVDALEDSIPVWLWADVSMPRVDFTPADALYCGGALLTRVSEGGAEFAAAAARADWDAAARRARDDVVRLATAWLLLQGVTRPRRSDAVHRFAAAAYGPGGPPTDVREVLEWAGSSFGPEGRDDSAPVTLPTGGPEVIASTIRHMRALVIAAGNQLRQQLRNDWI